MYGKQRWAGERLGHAGRAGNLSMGDQALLPSNVAGASLAGGLRTSGLASARFLACRGNARLLRGERGAGQEQEQVLKGQKELSCRLHCCGMLHRLYGGLRKHAKH